MPEASPKPALAPRSRHRRRREDRPDLRAPLRRVDPALGPPRAGPGAGSRVDDRPEHPQGLGLRDRDRLPAVLHGEAPGGRRGQPEGPAPHPDPHHPRSGVAEGSRGRLPRLQPGLRTVLRRAGRRRSWARPTTTSCRRTRRTSSAKRIARPWPPRSPRVNEEWITLADGGARILLETLKTPMVDQSGGPRRRAGHRAGHHRAGQPLAGAGEAPGPALRGAEAGIHRPLCRRGGPRLQQHAERDPLRTRIWRSPDGGGSPRAEVPRGDHQGCPPLGGSHRPHVGLRPPPADGCRRRWTSTRPWPDLLPVLGRLAGGRIELAWKPRRGTCGWPGSTPPSWSRC